MKGPPQAPVVLVPAAVTDLAVQRLGDEVSIRFVLPTENEDRSAPASLERVDVYAMTTRPRLPPDRTLELEEFMEAATLVASVEVAPPPDPGEADMDEAESDGGREGGEAPAETAPAEMPPPEAGAGDEAPRQGDPVLLTEALTAEIEAPVDPWEEERERLLEQEAEAREAEEEDGADEPERPVMVPLMTPPLPGPLQREYLVVQISEDGDESEGGERIAVPLGVRPPEPPPAPEVVYTETTVDVAWELPPGARETVQGPVTDEPFGVGEDTMEAEGVEESVEGGAAGDADTAEAEGTGAGATEAAGAEGSAGAAASPEASSDEASASDEAPVEDEAAASGEAGPDAGGDSPREVGAEEAGVEDGAPTDGMEEPVAPLTRLDSRPIVEWPPASTYELFEMSESDEDGSATGPERLSETPLAERAYTEERGEYGTERCYAVRTLDLVAGFEVRSRFSPATCVTFVDTFPPAAPEGLTAVGSAGEVSLLWRPNTEADVAGYLVLRGSPGDETLQPLTDAPVAGNTYRDTTAEPGVRHAYAVRAVDTADAPNPSEPSDRVEATAR